MSNEAKELLKQFDAAMDDSLNAVKKSSDSGKEEETKDKDNKKKKKLWK